MDGKIKTEMMIAFGIWFAIGLLFIVMGIYAFFSKKAQPMGFWWFMLMCDLLIPVILIIAGGMMWKHCPKTINTAYGYRTKLSMTNMETWKFAHDYCGKLWWKLGFVRA